MGVQLVHVKPIVLPHAPILGKLIDRIEAGGDFKVVADKDEKGGFKVEAILVKRRW